MGTCISKCRPSQSPTKQPSLPQDKLVISQSPRIASSVCISRGRRHSSSGSSSSSSSSSSTSSTSSSSFCSTTCSSSSSKDGYARSEPPWASARQHPYIVVLDPGSCKQNPLPPNPAKFPDQGLEAFSKTIPDAARRCQPPKRARSTSPALARQKSFRSSPEQSSAVPTRCQRQPPTCRPALPRQPTEGPLRTPSPVAHRSSRRELQLNTIALGSRNNLASPSPGRRFGGGAGVGHAKCVREELPRGELVAGENKPRACPVAARKERLRSSPTPCGSGPHAPRLRRRETSVHPIQTPLEQDEVAEMMCERACELAHMEDMNNPLIALDCFIFL